MSMETLQQVLGRLQAHPQAILAGGTDFYPALQDQPAPPEVIDVKRIPELRGIQPPSEAVVDGNGWRIGAGTTWTDLLHTDLPAAFDGLKAAAREVGSVQIQNVATLAGNLCTASPAADGVPALLTLDARVEVASVAGARQLPLSDFLLGPRQTALAEGELVTAIIVPEMDHAAVGGFAKLGSRRYLVISIAMVAMVLKPDDQGGIGMARVAVGACSPVARRLTSLESVLESLPLADCADAAAMQYRIADAVGIDQLDGLSPIDDIRASAHYRLEAVVELIRRLACTLIVQTLNH